MCGGRRQFFLLLRKRNPNSNWWVLVLLVGFIDGHLILFCGTVCSIIDTDFLTNLVYCQKNLFNISNLFFLFWSSENSFKIYQNSQGPVDLNIIKWKIKGTFSLFYYCNSLEEICVVLLILSITCNKRKNIQ